MAENSSQKLYAVALGLVPGIGCMLTKQLVSYCGSPEAAFKAPKARLLKVPGIGEKLADTIVNHRDILKRAEQELAKAEAQGVQLVFYTDEAYPRRLRELANAPALLYFKGNAILNAPKSIAIVGTRKATNYGKEVCERLMADLAKYNPLIVSGLAYGIDICAHRAALKHQLPTVAVMGSGIDSIYPPMHEPTARQMLQQGGLLTEYAFGTPADAPHFPSRNRIIAGLADAVIVVEAAASGGALITADIANDYGREVFAVPGSVFDKYSEGCHLLIKSHRAHLLASVADLEYILGWDMQKPATLAPNPPPELEGEEALLYNLLGKSGEMHLDDIGWQSQLGVSRAAVVLLGLEFKGLVKALPGKKFARV